MTFTKKDTLRSFVSLAIDSPVRSRIGGCQAEIIKKMAETPYRISWVKPETMHLTLKFLGDIPASKVESILKALQKAAEGIESFSLKIEGLGVFPGLKNPRVIWIGISEGAEPLQRLQARVEEELVRIDFPKEKKKFNAHLTLGRVRIPAEAHSLGALLASVASPVAGQSSVRDIRLMKSDLHPSGAIHTELGRILLS